MLQASKPSTTFC